MPQSTSGTEDSPYDASWLDQCEHIKENDKIYIKVTLKQALELAQHDLIASGDSSVVHTHMKLNLSKEPGKSIIFPIYNWLDYKGVTLLDVFSLSKTNFIAALHILLNFFEPRNPLMKNTPAQERNVYFKNFFDDVSYQTLIEKSYYGFFEFILDSNKTMLSSSIITGYIDELIKKHIHRPLSTALQPLDLSKASALSEYGNLNPEIEGFWPHNEAEQLIALQAKTSGEQAEPWDNRDSFLAALEALESIGQSSKENQNQIAMLGERVPKSLVATLLPLNVNVTHIRHYHCHCHRDSSPIPLDNSSLRSADSYTVTFPNKTGALVTLSWSGELGPYIKKYNLIPTKEFLKKFQSLLTACQTYFPQQAQQCANALKKTSTPQFENQKEQERNKPGKKISLSQPENQREKEKKELSEKIQLKIKCMQPQLREFKHNFLIQLVNALNHLDFDNPDAVNHFKSQYLLPLEDRTSVIYKQINQFGGSHNGRFMQKIGSIGAFFNQIGNNRSGVHTDTRLLVWDISDFIEKWTTKNSLKMNTN